jgi:hypothetical protein
MWPPLAHRRKTALKELVSVGIAMLALVISAVTAYFNIVRRSDEVSIVIPTFPGHWIEGKNLILSEFTIVLINTGDRDAVLDLIWLTVDQTTPGHDATDCKKGESVGVDGEPVVIKAKSAISKRFNPIALSDEKGEKSTIEVKLSEENIRNESFPLEVCIDLQISTPAEALTWKTISISRSEQFRKDGKHVNPGFVSHDTTRPIVIVRHVGSIFGD